MKKTLWAMEWRIGNKLYNNVFTGDEQALKAKEWIDSNGWKLYSISCL